MDFFVDLQRDRDITKTYLFLEAENGEDKEITTLKVDDIKAVQPKPCGAVRKRKLKTREAKDCSCRYTDCGSLDEEELKIAFEAYMMLRDSVVQNSFIIQNIEITPVASRKVASSKGKEFTRVYKINGKKVCKRLFQRTFGVSAGMLQRLLSQS